MRRLLVLTNALIFLDALFFTVLAPLLPDLGARFGLSDAELGVISAAFAWGAVVAALPAGFLAQRFGPRPVAAAGLALLSLSSLVFASANQIVLLDASRFAQGIACAIVWGAAMTWLLATVPGERRGATIGATVAASAAGGIAGPIMGAAAAALGTRWVFTGSLVFTVPLLLLVLSEREAPRLEHQPVRLVVATLASRPVAAAVALISVPAIAFGAVAILVPLKVHQLDGSPGMIAALFVGAAIIEMGLGPLSGRLSDSVGRQPVYIVGLLIYAISLVLMAAAGSLALLIVAFLSGALGGGVFITPALAALSDVADRADLAQSHAFALSNTAFVFGLALGGLAGGALASTSGDDVAYLIIAALLFLVAARGSRAWLSRPSRALPRHRSRRAASHPNSSAAATAPRVGR